MKRAVSMSIALLVGIALFFAIEGFVGGLLTVVDQLVPVDWVVRTLRGLQRWVTVAGGILSALVTYTYLYDRM
jgi:hypothetical protein